MLKEIHKTAGTVKKVARVGKSVAGFVPGPYGYLAKKALSKVEDGAGLIQSSSEKMDKNVKIVKEYENVLKQVQ